MKKIVLLILIVLSGISTVYADNEWKEIAAGTQFSLAIKADGSLWSWGANLNGQLGTGSSDMNSLVPKQIGTDKNWVKIACGGFHALAIKTDGTLWAWGINGNGEIGNSTLDQQNEPVQITEDNDWKEISAGMVSSFAIKNDGTLWAWGFDNSGQLGDGNSVDQEQPSQVGTDNDWMSVAGGGIHTIALKTDGSLWGWGYNGDSETGTGSADQFVTTPTRVGTDNGWNQIEAGFEFSMALKSNGTIWSWGFNGNGQLGTGDGQAHSTPYQIGIESDWSYIAVGASFAFGVKSNGTLWGWGFNLAGQLGDGTNNDKQSPVQIGVETDWIKLACAKGSVINSVVLGTHTLSIKNSQDHICAVGGNEGGQLGNNSLVSINNFDCSVTSAIAFDDKSPLGNDINVFPNPAVGQSEISLQFNSTVQEDAAVTMVDLFGKEIQKVVYHGLASGVNIAKLDVSAFPSGVYFVVVQINHVNKVFKIELIK